MIILAILLILSGLFMCNIKINELDDIPETITFSPEVTTKIVQGLFVAKGLLDITVGLYVILSNSGYIHCF